MIELKGVTFAYGDGRAVLKDIDLEVAKGKLTALLGPNGSGKSTLLGVVLGYLKPQTGSVILAGRPLGAYDRPALGRITGFVSQTATLPFNYSVADYVLLGRAAGKSGWAQPNAEDVDHVEAALAMAGIADLGERNVQELSAGELQLAAIARALCQEPRLLLLDEPTSHLDPAHALGVFRLLRKLVSEGLTVLMTTHDPLHARQVADRAVLLKKGKTIAHGDVADSLAADRLGALYGVPFIELERAGRRFPLTEV